MHRNNSQEFSSMAKKTKKAVRKIFTFAALSIAVTSIISVENSSAYANPFNSLNSTAFKTSLSASTINTAANSVIIINQRLDSLLADFAHREGLALKISKKIKTRVKSKSLPGNQIDFLNQLAKYYPIDWYKIGNELFISRKKDRVSRLINTGSISSKDLKSDIEKIIVNAKSFSFSSIKGSRSVLLSGPPTYVAFVELIIQGTLKSNQITRPIHIYKGGFEVSQTH